MAFTSNFTSRVLILILSLITISPSFSVNLKNDCNYIESYFPKTIEAEVLLKIGLYEKAHRLYEQAFDACQPLLLQNHHDLFNFAKCKVQLGEKGSMEIILKSLRQGQILSTYQTDQDFFPFIYMDNHIISNEWKKIQQVYPAIRKHYLQSVEMSLRDSIYQLTELGQEYRRNRNNLPDTLRRKLGIARDIVIQKAAKALVEENGGYIDHPQIGDYHIDEKHTSLSTILMHTPEKERFDYWIPLIKNEVIKGKCSPYLLANLIEQHRLYNGQEALLGTMGQEPTDKQASNQKRKELGLPNYWVDSLKMDLMRIR